MMIWRTKCIFIEKKSAYKWSGAVLTQWSRLMCKEIRYESKVNCNSCGMSFQILNVPNVKRVIFMLHF